MHKKVPKGAIVISFTIKTGLATLPMKFPVILPIANSEKSSIYLVKFLNNK